MTPTEIEAYRAAIADALVATAILQSALDTVDQRLRWIADSLANRLRPSP